MKPELLTAAICIVALFSVDLTYGYHPISPYAYCAGNPIKYVDPDGQDVWEINQNGEIVNRIKDKTQDAFFMVNNEGKRMVFLYSYDEYEYYCILVLFCRYELPLQYLDRLTAKPQLCAVLASLS